MNHGCKTLIWIVGLFALMQTGVSHAALRANQANQAEKATPTNPTPRADAGVVHIIWDTISGRYDTLRFTPRNLSLDTTFKPHMLPRAAMNWIEWEPKQIKIARQWRPLIAIKTDLLQWIGLTPDFDRLHTYTPNLALEYYFALRWSLQAGYAYSNWDEFGRDGKRWGVSQGYLEPRFYLKNDGQFCGLYVGLFGQYGSYDTQNPISGNTGTFFSFGASVGYVVKMSRHWYAEGGVRAAYRQAKGVAYDVQEGCYYHNIDQRTRSFAPQIQVSVVYRIGAKTR